MQSASALAEGVSVLARWNNSENPPAVMEKMFGKGRVLLFTTTAGKKWTDWPLDSTYLLAVRSAALAVARGQDEGESVTAGEPIRVVLDNDQAAIDPKIAAARQQTVRRPSKPKNGSPDVAAAEIPPRHFMQRHLYALLAR